MIGLKAGVHAITIPYMQGWGGQALSVSYSGPNTGKQTIPASAFFRVGGAAPASVAIVGNGTGLRGEYFNNKGLAAPSVLTRTDATIDFDWGNNAPANTINVDDFSIRWTGQVKTPVTDNYTFSTLTDNGVRLWVNGTMLVNDWNGHSPTTNTGPTIALVAGQKYDIRMEYFEAIIGAVARLSWAYPVQGQQIIPMTWLYLPGSTNARMATETSYEFDPELAVQVYPVPAHDVVQVGYMAQTAGELHLQLTSVAALPVMNQTRQVVAGEKIIRIPVADYNWGMYILSLVKDERRITRKVLLTE